MIFISLLARAQNLWFQDLYHHRFKCEVSNDILWKIMAFWYSLTFLLAVDDVNILCNIWSRDVCFNGKGVVTI